MIDAVCIGEQLQLLPTRMACCSHLLHHRPAAGTLNAICVQLTLVNSEVADVASKRHKVNAELLGTTQLSAERLQLLRETRQRLADKDKLLNAQRLILVAALAAGALAPSPGHGPQRGGRCSGT
jgi:hypothetical protein